MSDIEIAKLNVRLEESDKRQAIHNLCQKEAVEQAARDLRERLRGMDLRLDAFFVRMAWAIGVTATLMGGTIASVTAYLLTKH